MISHRLQTPSAYQLPTVGMLWLIWYAARNRCFPLFSILSNSLSNLTPHLWLAYVTMAGKRSKEHGEWRMEKRLDSRVESGKRGTPPSILQGVEKRLRKLRLEIGDWRLGIITGTYYSLSWAYEIWSMRYEIWDMKYEVWTVWIMDTLWMLDNHKSNPHHPIHLSINVFILIQDQEGDHHSDPVFHSVTDHCRLLSVVSRPVNKHEQWAMSNEKWEMWN